MCQPTFVHLFVCFLSDSKSHEGILMKFAANDKNGPRKR